MSIMVLILAALTYNMKAAEHANAIHVSAKLDIKIKNDLGDEITVINDGSGGTYSLSKNVVTTIKMEEGDKLYTYVKGKRDQLILTASSSMDSKVQLLSKLL